jgi:hypothetical protein
MQSNRAPYSFYHLEGPRAPQEPFTHAIANANTNQAVRSSSVHQHCRDGDNSEHRQRSMRPTRSRNHCNPNTFVETEASADFRVHFDISRGGPIECAHPARQLAYCNSAQSSNWARKTRARPLLCKATPKRLTYFNATVRNSSPYRNGRGVFSHARNALPLSLSQDSIL